MPSGRRQREYNGENYEWDVQEKEKLSLLRRTELSSAHVVQALDTVVRAKDHDGAGNWFAKRLMELGESPDEKVALGALRLAKDWVAAAETRLIKEIDETRKGRREERGAGVMDPDFVELDRHLRDLPPDKRRAILAAMQGQRIADVIEQTREDDE